jgi:hypothetical protein
MSISFQTSIFDQPTDHYMVRAIPKTDSHYWLINIHYAKRIPSISYAFGLFEFGELVGVITYGTPPSSTLCRGICGDQWQDRVLELNRLVLKNNKPNEASRLVGASLKMLPQPSIVVSFADTAQKHQGIVYQATNFIYTGLSAKFIDPVVKGYEHQHHATYAHGMTNAQVIQRYGADNVSWVDRSRKHRYIKFVGNKTDIRAMQNDLKYVMLDYPKN